MSYLLNDNTDSPDVGLINASRFETSYFGYGNGRSFDAKEGILACSFISEELVEGRDLDEIAAIVSRIAFDNLIEIEPDELIEGTEGGLFCLTKIRFGPNSFQTYDGNLEIFENRELTEFSRGLERRLIATGMSEADMERAHAGLMYYLEPPLEVLENSRMHLTIGERFDEFMKYEFKRDKPKEVKLKLERKPPVWKPANWPSLN